MHLFFSIQFQTAQEAATQMTERTVNSEMVQIVKIEINETGIYINFPINIQSFTCRQ